MHSLSVSNEENTNGPDIEVSDLPGFRKVARTYEKGKIIVLEGEPVDGVRILQHGRAKLSSSTADGRIMTIGIAEPGAVLGLAAAVDGSAFEATAEALERCRVDFVTRRDLLGHLRSHPEAAWNATVQLCTSYLNTHRLACTLAGSTSVLVRLARLFLGWVPLEARGRRRVRLEIRLTHQEIAEMVGTTRETTTRALARFRQQEIATMKGRELSIVDQPMLRLIAGDTPRRL